MSWYALTYDEVKRMKQGAKSEGFAPLAGCNDRAWVRYEDGTFYLRSYNTIVASITPDGVLHRHWWGWSATTAKHVRIFCGWHNIAHPNKAEWERMEVE